MLTLNKTIDNRVQVINLEATYFRSLRNTSTQSTEVYVNRCPQKLILAGCRMLQYLKDKHLSMAKGCGCG